MVTIKESIELLLRIIRSFGFTKIRAEVFRLAKFDDASSTQALWHLLFEGVYYCRYSSIDEVCARAFMEFSSREIVKYVKREMQRHGYLSRDFERLDTEMESGSRELLLAFGWLMCKNALIHQFCVTSIQPLLEGHTIESLVERETESESSNKPVKINHPITQDILKQMVWLNGRMRMNLKQLFWLRRERAGLEHQLHTTTQGLGFDSDRDHLSSTEVYLMKHPELLSKNLQLLEKDNERLQNLLKWRGHEDEFWQWMESVLDLKLQETAAAAEKLEPQCAPEAEEEEEMERDSSIASSTAALSRLSATERKLNSTVEKYEGIVELLEKQWSQQTMNVTKTEVELMIKAIDAEIRAFTLFMMKHAPKLSHGQLPLKLGKQKTNNSLLRDGIEHLIPDAASNVEREVDRLEAILTKLEKDVESNYTAFNDQLQTISRFTNSMVLQDPLSG